MSGLASQDPAALTISQGTATPPGEAAAGGLSLYAAVRLAARQPATSAMSGLARPGRQYYLFGVPGSVACRTVARDLHTAAMPTQPCLLLAGPVTDTSTNAAQIDRDLGAALLPGISPSAGDPDGGPAGNRRRAGGTGEHRASPRPAAYFVLRDRVALAGRNITDPHPSTDQSGSPDVQFGFTGVGATAFQRVTAAVAHRGQLMSALPPEPQPALRRRLRRTG